MNGSDDASRARVRCVVAAGRRAADPADPLGREARASIAATSGLSIEGVELALTEHLETNPAAQDLEALVAGVVRAPRCHVVLAANVCTAALRAIALATAAAPIVLLRASSRDPALATLLARTLTSDAEFARANGTIACVDDLEARPGDQVHVYGSDATVAAITAMAERGVVVRGHGTGFGVAILGATEEIGIGAEAIARDVVPFDQRGCLSPRAVLVEGEARRAEAFARALHAALESAEVRVPRGPLSPEDRASITLYREALRAVGEVWEGRGHVVGLDLEPRALLLPPPARVVHVVPAGRSAELLAPWARYLTTIGADPASALAYAAAALAPRARRARLGEMQRPPLDGPVDRR